MKRILTAVLAFFALFGGAYTATSLSLNQIQAPQAGPGLVGYGTDRRLAPVALGTGLDLTAGVLSAKAITAPARSYGVKLAMDGSGGFPLPLGVRVRPAIWRNGIRQSSGDDYTIIGDVVIPVSGHPWSVEDTILADGE